MKKYIPKIIVGLSIIIITLMVSVIMIDFDEVQMMQQKTYLNIPLSHELQDFTKNQCEYIGVPYELVIAVMDNESGFNPDIVSTTNDYGLMQINRGNHEWLKEMYGLDNLLDERQNIIAGVYMVGELYSIHKGDVSKTLMVYNMGGTMAIANWNKGIYETAYTRKVESKYETYRDTTN